MVSWIPSNLLEGNANPASRQGLGSHNSSWVLGMRWGAAKILRGNLWKTLGKWRVRPSRWRIPASIIKASQGRARKSHDFQDFLQNHWKNKHFQQYGKAWKVTITWKSNDFLDFLQNNWKKKQLQQSGKAWNVTIYRGCCGCAGDLQRFLRGTYDWRIIWRYSRFLKWNPLVWRHYLYINANGLICVL